MPGQPVICAQNHSDKEIPLQRALRIRRLEMLSNRHRARPLRARPHKRVTLTMVGFFTNAATIKSKHFRREELIRSGKKHMFLWQRSLMAKQLLHGAKGRKSANAHPESAFGWVRFWVGPWALVEMCLSWFSLTRPLPSLDAQILGARLRARTATQRSKTRVLRRFWEGFWVRFSEGF